MVKSAMAGPEVAVTTESYGTGPFTNSRTFANPTGDLFFAKWMIETLGPVRARVRNGWLA